MSETFCGGNVLRGTFCGRNRFVSETLGWETFCGRKRFVRAPYSAIPGVILFCRTIYVSVLKVDKVFYKPSQGQK